MDEDSDFLWQGVNNGFKLINEDTVLPFVEVKNHSSAINNYDVTTNIISDEIKKGRYIICDQWIPNIISPIGLVPKSNGEFRLIHDCSAPMGTSLNDFSVELDKCRYESVDSAVANMTEGCYMAKVDIKAAYRGVAIHPTSYSATGLRWNLKGQDVYMVDTRLPFGARPSPTVFHRISQCVKREMHRRGYMKCTAYQDDFLLIADSHDECLTAWLVLINLLLQLGFDINYSKLEPPSTNIVFLGVELNSVYMQLSLPQEKLDSIRHILGEFRNRPRATKRQLQSLAGRLNFAARVVRGGRTFLRRILTSYAKLRRPYHKVRLKGAITKDIEWWHDYMRQFNGVATCFNAHQTVTIVTDACITGGGSFCAGDFYYVDWEVDHKEISKLPINYKETAMAAISILRWAPKLANRTVYVYSDNQCAVAIISKATCRNEKIMSLLRQLFWASASYNFVIKIVYLPGNLNIVSDTVSRLHEPGQLLHLEAIINEWYLCHRGLRHAFDSVSLCNHMSLGALCSILQHVTIWRNLRSSSMS